MPYEIRGKCIYKKDGGAKVGCTKGDVHKYMAALHANANESKVIKLKESDLLNLVETKLNEIKLMNNNRGQLVGKIEKNIDLTKMTNEDKIKEVIKAMQEQDTNYETHFYLVVKTSSFQFRFTVPKFSEFKNINKGEITVNSLVNEPSNYKISDVTAIQG